MKRQRGRQGISGMAGIAVAMHPGGMRPAEALTPPLYVTLVQLRVGLRHELVQPHLDQGLCNRSVEVQQALKRCGSRHHVRSKLQLHPPVLYPSSSDTVEFT